MSSVVMGCCLAATPEDIALCDPPARRIADGSCAVVVVEDAKSVRPFEEYNQRLRAHEQVSPLGSTLFGDGVSLYHAATRLAL